MSKWIRELEEKLQYHFKDEQLVHMAMTHSSYVNEHSRRQLTDNERLEFLGDAILEAVSSEYLFHKHPDKGEGWLSKTRASMVCEPSLAICARDLGIPAYLKLGNGEEQMGGRGKDSIVSDAMEALIGAVFLDGGFEEAKKVILNHILLDLKAEDLFQDKKTRLQEILGESGRSVTYELLGEEGPPHEKTFCMAAIVDGQQMGVGSGRSKKAAAQEAAQRTIEMLKE